jgi:hypothetical protein
VPLPSNHHKISVHLDGLIGQHIRVPKSNAPNLPPAVLSPEEEAARARERAVNKLAFDIGFTAGEARFYLADHGYDYDQAKAAVNADLQWERTHGAKIKAQRQGAPTMTVMYRSPTRRIGFHFCDSNQQCIKVVGRGMGDVHVERV